MVDGQLFVEIPEFRQSDFSGGILTRKVFERLQPFVDQMNAQANVLDDWREKVIQTLRLPLLDQTSDPNGEFIQLNAELISILGNIKEVLTPKKTLHHIRRFCVKLLLVESKLLAGS